MSKALLFFVLVILVSLLGVMSYLTSPHPPKPPDPALKAMAAKASQEQMTRQMKQRQEMMSATMKKMSKIEKDKAATEKSASAAKKITPGSINISAKWFHDRQPGAVGVQQAQKELEEAKKQQMAELKAMQEAANGGQTAPIK